MGGVEKPRGLSANHVAPRSPVQDMRRCVSMGYPEPKGPLPDAPKDAKSTAATRTKGRPLNVVTDTPMSEVLRHLDTPSAKSAAAEWAAAVQHHPGLVPENIRPAVTRLAALLLAGKLSAARARELLIRNPSLKDFLSQPERKLIASGSQCPVAAGTTDNKSPNRRTDTAKAQSLRHDLDKAHAADAKTVLVDFATAPFPYAGRVPESNRPFLDVGKPGHLGHTNGRGEVLWESKTFNDSRVLLHIPPGFDAKRPAVMMVFFHGHDANLARDVRDREHVPAQISAAGANVVLVAPQFAVNAADGSAGKFWETGGFKRFLDEAAKQLGRLHGDQRTVQAFAKMPVVIVAYSGGYKPALSVLDRGGANSRVRGVVLLDALYNGIDKFADWIANNRSAFFISSYTPYTRGNNDALKRALAVKSVSYATKLSRNHLSGSVTFLPAGNVPHWDFVNHAWVGNPLRDLLVRLDDLAPQIKPATKAPASTRLAASPPKHR
jgi:hypothetical protein